MPAEDQVGPAAGRSKRTDEVAKVRTGDVDESLSFAAWEPLDADRSSLMPGASLRVRDYARNGLALPHQVGLV